MLLLRIDDLEIEVVRKKMRTLRLSVHMPDGRVRVSAPLGTPEATIREMVVARKAWIAKHQARFTAREQPRELAYQTGEQHRFQGYLYSLQVQLTTGREYVALSPEQTIELHVREGSGREQRKKLLHEWYREQLKAQLPALQAKWQPIVGVQAQTWAIKQMKTRWGTCNIAARRIWLNLELIKHPLPCLEYVVAHELTHLHERHHNARFWGLMDQFMPEWRHHKAALNHTGPGC